MKEILEDLKEFVIDNRDNITKDKLIDKLNLYNMKNQEKDELADILYEDGNISGTSSYTNYLNTIGKYKTLEYDELIDLFKKMHKGDMNAREKIINSNLKFVVMIAKRFKKNSDNIMDIIEEGNYGLMKAVDKFDYKLGYKFTTYAAYWIKNYILLYLKKENHKIYQVDRELFSKIEECKKELMEKLKIIPSSSEIISYYNQKYNKYIDLHEYLKLEAKAKDPISLNSTICNKDGDDIEYIEIISDTLDDAGEIALNNIYYEKVRDAILNPDKSNLDKQERNILILHFGFDCDPLSLSEIALKYKVSAERIRQIELKAIRKLIRHNKTKRLFKN